MHEMRRVATIITRVLMIPLVIVSSSIACPMAGAGSAHAMSSAMMGAATRTAPLMADHATPPETSTSAVSHTTSHVPVPHHPRPHRSGSHCTLPCTPAGCTMGTQCTVLMARAGTPLHGQLDVNRVRTSTRTDAPHSVSIAPEPPPPRV